MIVAGWATIFAASMATKYPPEPARLPIDTMTGLPFFPGLHGFPPDGIGGDIGTPRTIHPEQNSPHVLIIQRGPEGRGHRVATHGDFAKQGVISALPTHHRTHTVDQGDFSPDSWGRLRLFQIFVPVQKPRFRAGVLQYFAENLIAVSKSIDQPRLHRFLTEKRAPVDQRPDFGFG